MDPQTRYAEIQRKEAELRAREDALRKEQMTLVTEKEPNFPPLIHLVYHNIAEEIPSGAQATVRLAFAGQILFVVSTLLNLLSGFGMSPLSGTYTFAYYIIFPIVIFLFGVPLCFKINYYKFYSDVKTGDLGIGWLCLQILLVILSGVAAVGLKDTGLCGFIVAIDSMKTNSAYLKIMSFITASFFILLCVYQVFIFGKGLVLYKNNSGYAPQGNGNTV